VIGEVVKLSAVTEIIALGTARIGEHTRVQARTMELVTLLAERAGPVPRTLLEDALFEQTACASGVSTLVYRARKLGLQIDFLENLEAYTLSTPVKCDHLEVLAALETHDWEAVLRLYHGPFLVKSRGPYAQTMRSYLSDRLMESALQERDLALLSRLARVMPESAALWEHLADLGHAAARVMCGAMRKGLRVYERRL